MAAGVFYVSIMADAMAAYAQRQSMSQMSTIPAERHDVLTLRAQALRAMPLGRCIFYAFITSGGRGRDKPNVSLKRLQRIAAVAWEATARIMKAS
ncbi:hypothetical protein ANO14919_024950 [Xylariales sp. No.14919]|nr:hypothetical protein ANO14919_024950 [Xylariales sp. No.14919]